MDINRRHFLVAGGLVAVAGLSGRTQAAGELNAVRGKTYVAACPPVKASIPRTPGPYRIMVIGGHPDDADIICGCTAAKLIGKGCDALDCQVSQFYEWLPWDKGTEDEVAAIGDRKANIAGPNAYLKKYWARRKVNDAECFAAAWREQYSGRPVPEMVEAYEISEYGRPPIEEDFALLMED